MKHEYSTYALVILGGVLFFSFIIALDSGDLDLICNVNGSVLKRVNGTWVCGTDLTGNSTGRDTNESVRFNLLVSSDCPTDYKAIGVNLTGGLLCSPDLNTGFSQDMNDTQFNDEDTIKDSYLTSKCVAITGSNELCDGDDNTGSDSDNQLLTYVNYVLSISNGNSVNLSDLKDTITGGGNSTNEIVKAVEQTGLNFSVNKTIRFNFNENGMLNGDDQAVEFNALNPEAKPYLSWKGYLLNDSNGQMQKKYIGWFGCHYNTTGNSDPHEHCSIETLDLTTGTINTRFEVTYGDAVSELYAKFSSLAYVELGSGVDLLLNGASSDIRHTTDMDFYPSNQVVFGLRISNNTKGMILLSALGQGQLGINDKLYVAGNINTTGDIYLNSENGNSDVYIYFGNPQLTTHYILYDKAAFQGYSDTGIVLSDEVYLNQGLTVNKTANFTQGAYSTGFYDDGILLTPDTNDRHSHNTTQFTGNETFKVGSLISWLVSICSTITGSSDLCDGNDATGTGTGGGNSTEQMQDAFSQLINSNNFRINVTYDDTSNKMIFNSEEGNPRTFTTIELEFLTGNANVFGELLGAAVSSGTMASTTFANQTRPGIIYLRDSTTANGGYYIQSATNSFLINGSEVSTFIFNDVETVATYQFRFGFQDSASVTIPTDGCYFEGINKKVSASCVNSAVETQTATNYTITRGVWYKGVMNVSNTANAVDFKLYNAQNTLLWNRTISNNIPVNKARLTGWGVIATEGSVDSATDIIYLDYISLKIPRTLVR